MPASASLVRAGLLRRLASMAYELILLFAVVAVALILPHVLLAAFAHYMASGMVLRAHLFIVLLVYFLCFWTACVNRVVASGQAAA